jgi:hypothetical protein
VKAGGLLSQAGDAAALVYRETTTRARLLANALRRRDPEAELLGDDLAAHAEAVTLPEPLLRSKVG